MKISDFLKSFQKSREQEIDDVVREIVKSIMYSDLDFTNQEQKEILDRVILNIFERKREKRAQLIKEAREIQEVLKEIKI